MSNLAHAENQSPRLMRIRQVMDRTGFSRSHIYALAARSGAFPQPVRIGGVSAWVSSEVDAYIAGVISASRGAA